MRRLTLWFCAVIAAGLGCQPRQPPASTPGPFAATRPTVQFASSEHGIRLSYPAEWSPVPSDEYVLRIAPAGDPGELSISLDVPKLPPHIPGLIPLGMVVNGYVDDLRKQDPAVKVDQPVATKVGGANARRVRSTRQSSGRTLVEEAVLTVHGDRVYIFRANADTAHGHEAQNVLIRVLTSVKWE
jgi:hypothetical protein